MELKHLDKLVTLKLRLHGRTALSLLVSKHGDADRAVWLRKASIVGEQTVEGDTVKLTITARLAQSERLT
jgi:hypothetical protein